MTPWSEEQVFTPSNAKIEELIAPAHKTGEKDTPNGELYTE